LSPALLSSSATSIWPARCFLLAHLADKPRRRLQNVYGSRTDMWELGLLSHEMAPSETDCRTAVRDGRCERFPILPVVLRIPGSIGNARVRILSLQPTSPPSFAESGGPRTDLLFRARFGGFRMLEMQRRLTRDPRGPSLGRARAQYLHRAVRGLAPGRDNHRSLRAVWGLAVWRVAEARSSSIAHERALAKAEQGSLF
jgi:hypothetical protein